ncbi:MAG: hypothetical protein Kow0025_02180 [Thermodesulfovibrionales bacterium]
MKGFFRDSGERARPVRGLFVVILLLAFLHMPGPAAEALHAPGTVEEAAVIPEGGWLPRMDSQQIPTWLRVYGNVDKPGPHPSGTLIALFQAGYFDTSTAPGQFKLFKVRPGITGTFTESVSYRLLAEFAHNAVLAPTSGGARLLDASITFSFKPVRFQLGQSVTPFASDETPAAVVPWIDFSDVVKNIYLKDRVTDTVTNAARELGLTAWQEFTLNPSSRTSLTYFLGYFNGTGISQSDSNDSKDFMGHLRLKHGPFNVGASYWTGSTDIQGQSLDKDKFDVHAYYGSFLPGHNKDRLWALLEYMSTKEEQPGGGDLEADGWQAALGVRPTKDTMLTYRYSEYNQEPVGGPENEITMHSIIGQYFVPGAQNLRVMVQYDIRDNRLNAEDDSAFWFQVSVPFAFPVFGGKS